VQFSKFTNNLSIALSSIRANKWRAFITITIIAIGIAALISMLTAVEAMKTALVSSLGDIGSNKITITQQSNSSVSFGRRGRKNSTQNPEITYYEASLFKKNLKENAVVSYNFNVSGDAICKTALAETNPKTNITSVDENYLPISSLKIIEGRNFTNTEVEKGNAVAIIGAKLSSDLFVGSPIGKTISIENVEFKVVGIVKSPGTLFGNDNDDDVWVPFETAKSKFNVSNPVITIEINVNDVESIDKVKANAEGEFRSIRRLRVGEVNNFGIEKSDATTKVLVENLSVLTLVAIFIGMITLLGAAVALTNIMLVSVTERTKEIGIRKSLGATKKNIRSQFLIEAITICIIGGLIGVVLGLLLGNIVAILTDVGFIMPWFWVIVGLILCYLTGVFSGIFPANKAAKLDPIESLRYE
jgi:putative ABC transport system permease protein